MLGKKLSFLVLFLLSMTANAATTTNNNAGTTLGGSTLVTASGGTTPRPLAAHLANKYDARNYGVKCDGTETGDGVGNAGSPTLTSASYTYKASDIGKRAQLISKNNSVLVANGIITGGSGNSVTIDTNALYTGTNLRFVIYRTDDAVALNNLNAAVSAAGGGAIQLPNGVCTASFLTLKRKTFYEGDAMVSTKLLQWPGANRDFIKSENYDDLTGTGLNYGPSGTFNSVASSPLVPSWYGLLKLTIDANWTNQGTLSNALSMYGNATSLDAVEVMGCSGDCIRTEASDGYAYSPLDIYAQEEGWYGRVFIRDYGVNGWRDRGPHDSEKNNITIYNSSNRGTGWGYISEASENYLGSGYIGVIHAYPGASNISITGQSKIGVIYNDLGKTRFTGSNTSVGLVHNLGCGYLNTTPCIEFAAGITNVTITEMIFQWYWGTVAAGSIGVDIPATANNIKVNINGSKQATSAANTIIVRNRGNNNIITGNLSGSIGSGAVCADMGGSYNSFDFNTKSCAKHLVYNSGGLNNEIGLRAQRAGSEVAFEGTINPADTFSFNGNEQKFFNAPKGSLTYPGLTFGGVTTGGFYGGTNNLNLAFANVNTAIWDATGFYSTAGTLSAGVSGSVLGQLKLNGNASGTVTVRPAASAGNWTMTLPPNAGTSGQVLTTDGAGTSTWTTVSGGGGGATSPGGTDGQIQYNNAGSFGGVTAVPVANGGTGQTTKVAAQAALEVPKYALAANSHGLPVLSATNAAWVRNNWKKHVVPSNGADYTCIRVKYVNWYLTTNSEQQGSFDFILRAGLIYKNKAYRFKFNGQTDYELSRVWGEVWSDPLCEVTLKSGDSFYITNREVASDGGVAGSYAHKLNSGGIGARQDGVIYGSDPTVDYTMGAGVCYGHTYNAATVNGTGNLTAGNIKDAGIGCTSGLVLNIWCGAAGCNTPGAQYPGSGAGAGGYCNVSANKGGQVSSIFLNGNNGNDYSATDTAIATCGGSGTAATGFGTNTSLYTASIVAGIPSKPVPSVLLFGDSLTVGFGSVDGTGNFNGSEGMMQQRLDTLYGTTKIAVSGESCGGYAANKTHQEDYMVDLVNHGLQITHVINGLATNDLLNSTAAPTRTNLEACNTARNAYFKSTFGAKVYQNTVTPVITVGSSKTDKSLMTPANSNFNLGGVVETYNTNVKNLTMGADGYIDIDAFARDQDTNYRNLPRTDAFAAGDRSCTTTSGSNVVTMADTSDLFPSNVVGVHGTGIPAGAEITAVTRNTSVTLSANATASGTVTCSFTTEMVTGDGVHWGKEIGIPHLVKNLTVPTFTVP